jgi:hypothetical protein
MMIQKAVDMVGKKFGRLLVLKRAENDKYGNAFWVCQCECGNVVRVKGQSLRRGHTKSCGCLQREMASISGLKNHHLLRAFIPWNKGISIKRPQYYKQLKNMYYAMKQRCYNSHNAEFEHYGGRGITICKEWQTFDEFYKWAIENNYKEELTIERVDNNKGYSPDNCRFATRAEQNRNTSRNNRVIDLSDGKVYVTAEVARIIGVTRSTVAKWYREEGLRFLQQYQERYNNIVNYNKNRTRRCKGVMTHE